MHEHDFEGDATDIAHVFFAFVGGLTAAESAHRLGGSKQSVDRRWRVGLNALIDGFAHSSTRRRPGRS